MPSTPRLRQIRRRDPHAWNYGRYELLDFEGTIVAAGPLRDIVDYLTRPR